MKYLVPLLLSMALITAARAQDPVLAQNQWTTVTKADFEVELARIPKDQQFTFLASAERVAKTVEGILVSKTFAAKARAARLHESPAVKAEIAFSIDRVLARHAIEKAESELSPPDFAKRAGELFRANRNKYSEKDVFTTMHVVIDTKCRTPEVAKARAQEARAELLEGKPFEEVARKYSDDPSVAKNGGDIGPFMLDNLAPAYAEAVKNMKPGEISQPVHSSFGYHVVKLTGVKKGRMYEFDEVRPTIVAEVREDWLKQQRKELIEQVTSDPKLKLDLDAIQALKTNINVPAPLPKRPG